MSHYRVAVIQTPSSPDIDELMMPYSEHIEVEPYVDATRDEALASARRYVADGARRVRDGSTDGHDIECTSHDADDDQTLLAWYADWCGQDADAEGNLLATYNPKSKWDYYGEIETLTFDEWLQSGTEATEEELRDEWRRLSTQGNGLWSEAYYFNRYSDGDTFVKACHLPDGWAVVTPDGEWHEPGRVGWFATDDSTPEAWRDWVERFEERFIAPYDPDETTVTILDCHI